MRHADESPPKVMWCSGDVVDLEFLRGEHKHCQSAINLGDWAWAWNTTDRARAPVSIASADVFHIYGISLSYIFAPPRTFLMQDVHAQANPNHTSWAHLLDVNPEGPTVTQTPTDEYGIAAITAVRKRGVERECLVHWHNYGRGQATWERERTVEGTESFQRLIHATPQMIKGRTSARSVAEWKNLQRNSAANAEDDSGEPLGYMDANDANATRVGTLPGAIRLEIFRNLCQTNAPKGIMDDLYSVLLDAEPVGNARCRREWDSTSKRGGPLHRTCVTCAMANGILWNGASANAQVRELTRHTHHECPTSILLLDTVYRAVAEATCSNAVESRRIDHLSPRELTNELRLPLVTGYRHIDHMRMSADNTPMHHSSLHSSQWPTLPSYDVDGRTA